MSSIQNIETEIVFYDSVKIAVEEENYNLLKGWFCYKEMKNPLGLLGGLGVRKSYENVIINKVDLVLTVNNKKIRYCEGIFISDDEHLDICYEHTQELCYELLSERDAVREYK